MLTEISEFSGTLRNRTSLPDRVEVLLRKLLITGKIKPGERIVETRIARDLGVGQPTVREALKSLEEQGLVIRHPNRGCVVTKLSRKEIDQVYRLRMEWEPLAIDLALENWNPSKASDLTAAADHMLEAAEDGDAEQYYRWDLEFHQTLWRMADNPYLEKALLQIVLPLFSFAMIRLTGSDTDWVSDAKEHGAIARAIQSGDKEIAKKVCRAGLELFWKKSIALLAEEERQQGVGA
jgi:DNA-binding GntR family transcriptional regulator